MIEIGTSGPPWRAAAIAIGTTMAAEADGLHAVWFAAELPVPVDAAAWATLGGPMPRVVADPADLADPVVTATAALLVSRRIRIGVLGWNPGPDADHAARTVATLADLAPGRAVLGIAAAAEHLDALVAHVRPDLGIDLAVYGADPAPAARHGLGWICGAEDPATLAERAGDAGVTGRLGLHLPVCVHPDPDTALAATEAGLLAGFPLAAVGAVVGDADALGATIDAAVAAGVTRIVIENVLPFGAPDEVEASQAAIRTAVRSARLRHREVPA
jgi:alkanesulfonate monooxygenase SsuD/methylene tetrahydromethanopterin reductase-like flavin-dependent oxidoreductase (luciferase family)